MTPPAIALLPAVAVPVYKPELTAAERLSLDRLLDVLAGRALFLVGPEHLRPWMADLCQRSGQGLRYLSFEDRYFSGIAGYNELMLSKRFYEAFSGYSHVLIAQTDALVLSDRLDEWCARDFSYVGAPWFVGGSEPEHPLQFLAVGNGGFSLRRIADFLRVLAVPRRIPNFIKSGSGGGGVAERLVRKLKHEWCFAYNRRPFMPTSNEDAFWGLLVPAVCAFFRVPTPEEAIAFAFEAEPRVLYGLNGQQLPFGCHAWERFDKAFWQEVLPFLGRDGAASVPSTARPRGPP